MTSPAGAAPDYAEWLHGHTLPSGAGRAFADELAPQTPPPGPDEPDDEPDDEPVQIPGQANGPAPAGPSLLITFAGPGLADMTIVPSGNPSLGQVMAAAGLFSRWADDIWATFKHQQAAPQIIRAAPSALAGGRWPQRRF